jgi:hypothetical protein
MSALKMLILWVVTSCVLIGTYQRFEEHTVSNFSPENRISSTFDVNSPYKI